MDAIRSYYVCWDQWYPEAARLMALKGAQILIYPTAIGWFDGDSEAEKQRQVESWIMIQRSHAIANGIPVLSCRITSYNVCYTKLLRSCF